jgi:hypothetical protein
LNVSTYGPIVLLVWCLWSQDQDRRGWIMNPVMNSLLNLLMGVRDDHSNHHSGPGTGRRFVGPALADKRLILGMGNDRTEVGKRAQKMGAVDQIH